ncbi:MAG: hypothetical protein IPP72_01895 [Chitinophagaceae bacterium]|nr:hypothetical protein [Chitinophagaceae bacterium]
MINCIFKTFAATGLLLICNLLPAQNVGIGTPAPNASAQLDISSTSKGLLIPRLTTLQRTAIAAPANGLMVYDTGLSAFWFYNGSAWSAVGGAGVGQWTANGNNIYNSNTGNVGIGISNPVTALHIHSPNNVYDAYMRLTNQTSGTTLGDGSYVGLEGDELVLGNQEGAIGLYTGSPQTSRMHITSGGFVGIGTASPFYKVQVNDGSIALYNSTDLKYWIMQYSSSGNYFSFQEDGISRLTILPGGNVGIGTINPAYKLDVSGAIRASGNIQSQGSLSVTSTATINGGGGVAYNPNSGANLKITPFTTLDFHAILGPHGSAETTIGLPSGFTSTPSVFVGSINSTGGLSGELNRVILVLWGCNTNSCIAKIINTDNVSVDYTINWRCLAVGN